MNIKKIAAVAAAVVMAAGIVTGVPMGTDNAPITAITAEAASSDFVIITDDNGDKCVSEYKGNGGDITIPDGVLYIREKAFAGNDKITSVTFPKSCKLVDKYSFAECLNLKKVVFEGDVMFQEGAFNNCVNLESVTVKGSIYVGIGTLAFGSCQNLKTVKISGNENDFIICPSAFRDCYSLTSINIPSKCTEIYGCAFLNCFNLTKLTIPAKTKINTDNGGIGHFGYVSMYKTEEECKNALYGKDAKADIFVADGKTSEYYYNLDVSAFKGAVMGEYNSTLRLGEIKKFTPKQLTVTVTKGSPAEKWAKANKVKYTYASSSSSSASAGAPANFKASKTTNSVTLSWDAVEGADLYRVYKYNPETKKYEKYKDVKSAKCTVSGLKANTKYKFKVTAYDKVNGKYVKGETSKAVSVTTKK
ncbi:MAG: fibronectin type III domain-containing protein [Eubacterium sp.]|nr:fibronectin type III domain-containing protein [Eubacterium sp.]